MNKIAAVDIGIRSTFSSSYGNMCMDSLYKNISLTFRDSVFKKWSPFKYYIYTQLIKVVVSPQKLPLQLIFHFIGQKSSR